MPMLKVYQWEREKWPEFSGAWLRLDEAGKITTEFARRFKVPLPSVTTGKRFGNGEYRRGEKTIRVGKLTTLAVLLHELGHHLDHCLNPERAMTRGHGGSFKSCLRRVYRFGKAYLPTEYYPWNVNGKQHPLFWEAWQEATKCFRGPLLVEQTERE